MNSSSFNFTHHHHQEQQSPCTSSPSQMHLSLAMFSFCVMTTGIVSNLTTVLVVLLTPQLRRKGTYMLQVSLAISDLGVSVFVTSVKVDMYYHNGTFCHHLPLCVFFQVNSNIPLFFISFPVTFLTHALFSSNSNLGPSTQKLVQTMHVSKSATSSCKGTFRWPFYLSEKQVFKHIHKCAERRDKTLIISKSRAKSWGSVLAHQKACTVHVLTSVD